MSELNLSFAITACDRVLPFVKGDMKPDGIIVDYVGMPGAVPWVFYEPINFQTYDASEMIISDY